MPGSADGRTVDGVDADWLYRRVVLPLGGAGLLLGVAGLVLTGTHYTSPEGSVLGHLGYAGFVDDVSTAALAGWGVFLAGAAYRARYVNEDGNDVE